MVDGEERRRDVKLAHAEGEHGEIQDVTGKLRRNTL